MRQFPHIIKVTAFDAVLLYMHIAKSGMHTEKTQGCT